MSAPAGVLNLASPDSCGADGLPARYCPPQCETGYFSGIWVLELLRRTRRARRSCHSHSPQILRFAVQVLYSVPYEELTSLDQHGGGVFRHVSRVWVCGIRGLALTGKWNSREMNCCTFTASRQLATHTAESSIRASASSLSASSASGGGRTTSVTGTDIGVEAEAIGQDLTRGAEAFTRTVGAAGRD